MIVLTGTMQQDDPHFEISRLLAGLINGTLTTEEMAKLEAWRQESVANRELYERMTDPAYLSAQLENWEAGQEQAKEDFFGKRNGDPEPVKTDSGRRDPANRMHEELKPGRREPAYLKHENLKPDRRDPAKIRRLFSYAAAILLLLALAGGAAFLLKEERKPLPVLQVKDMRADSSLVPKGDVARLVMNNGHEVALNGKAEQEFEEEDGTKVKNGYSALRYQSHGQPANTEPVYHTLVTPKGGEYTVMLADGTMARLNAASSLRFPTRFEGKERVVELSGEAYFEVAKDAAHPFIVKTARSLVRVLGTAFNVYAYTDMPEERTTLASGAVKVGRAQQGGEVMLQPGFQARIQTAGNNVQVVKADMEEALAWKNGLFVFNAASLGDILHQVGRWYDVEIHCESSMERKFHFSGRIHRYENIAGVLELLEMTGKVRFVLQGRTLTVRPAV